MWGGTNVVFVKERMREVDKRMTRSRRRELESKLKLTLERDVEKEFDTENQQVSSS